MKSNPYSLLFGKKPSQMISRQAQVTYITESFNNTVSPQQIYVITGVRGSGKTVLMTEVSGKMRQDKDWIVIELNPEKDMLMMLGAALSGENYLARLFQNAEINLSFFGFGLSVKNAAPITDIEVALSKMLAVIQKQGKKVLITIDEAVNTKDMRVFISAFQIFIRNDLPLFLLMTGLYENISDLQNEKSLTFLYRAPKIEMKPLDNKKMAENYAANLSVSEETAADMAKITKGYSFAFQTLGYFTYENGQYSDTVVSETRDYLEEYSYKKIWSELSDKDKYVLNGIAKSEDGKIAGIRKILDMETNQFNPYRKRLINKGILNGNKYGYLYFYLPFFREFVLEEYENDTAVFSV